ncbi:DUF4397 domain-containing protein [Neptunomonas marina]|uniref:DUF4397 domain-containing protein n=1 Tax=Neptunomonas marina TaxID=1815562 RepID=A0A437Q497_9GAMM|nr:DUF4397 domain-containing protein [Neptunomonas marina]RVU29324.1 DUF4397 domain-containing protein [Neptunomonas marina]
MPSPKVFLSSTKLVIGTAVSVGMLTLAGCGGGGGGKHEPAQSQLRVTHASPDAPMVNVYVNGKLTLEKVDYKVSSGNLMLAPGDYEVEVRGILPDGSETAAVIGPVTLTTADNERLDVVATNDLAAIAPVLIRTNIEEITDVAVSVLHAAPDVADVDIYVTTPGAALMTGTKIDADFGDSAGPLTLAAGTDYQIRIVPDGGDSSAVVYDSGTVNFTSGTELLLLAVENTTGIGANPVNLLAVDSSKASELFTAGTNAEVRAIHMSADTPEVDVLVGAPSTNLMAPDNVVLMDVPFKAAGNYDSIAAPTGTYNLEVEDAATNSLTPIDVDIDLMAGTSYTAIASGSLNAMPTESIEPILFADDRRAVATEAKLRVVHASYIVAQNIPVDVYLTATNDISTAMPAITNLAYGEYTEQLPVAGGEYFVTVTAAGDPNTVVFGAPLMGSPTMLSAGGIYTVIARDPAAMEDLGTNSAGNNAITLEVYTAGD